MAKTLAQAKAPPLITLSHCSIVLSGRRVLDDVDFILRDRERWALVGPNGAGKTLLLKLLRGDMWPTPTGDERRLYCFDGDCDDQPIDAKERVVYVGPEQQDKYVRYDWNYSVSQVVTTGLFHEDIPRSQPSRAQRQRVIGLLKRFRLWSLRQRRFLTLSYGQRRRTLIARAFAGEPQVLLLDEIFNGLDAASTAILRQALRRTRGVGSTWIVTAHRRHDVPPNATQVARMQAGKIVKSVELPPLSNEKRKPMPVRRHGPKTKNAGVLIRLRNVDLYRDYRLVLRNVDWTLLRGEHWGVMGANGSGKSTFLKLLYGDLHPKLGGEIERDGVPFGTPISEWKRRVGLVSPELQADYFLARDLEEVVISGRYSSVGLNEAPTTADRKAAHRWLNALGLSALAHRRPREVSYGQLRLALIARAMINGPELLLLDEPCTGLDPQVRHEVLARLDRLAAQGVQLVMAVHDVDDLPSCIEHRLTIQRKQLATSN